MGSSFQKWCCGLHQMEVLASNGTKTPISDGHRTIAGLSIQDSPTGLSTQDFPNRTPNRTLHTGLSIQDSPNRTLQNARVWRVLQHGGYPLQRNPCTTASASSPPATRSSPLAASQLTTRPPQHCCHQKRHHIIQNAHSLENACST